MSAQMEDTELRGQAGVYKADRQGDIPDRERVERAMQSFAADFGTLAALRLESCIHCGMCADACHFYIATDDPQYTPVLKAEPFKQAYKREAGPFAPVFRLFGLKHKITVDELERWQHLLYDSCTLCGRCSVICPMGIDVAALIEDARAGLFEAGLAPTDLYAPAERQHETGDAWGADMPYVDKLKAIGQEHGVDIPLDRAQADVLLLVSGIELLNYPGQVAALARTMAHLGVSCTFRSEALLAENIPHFAGAREWQDALSRQIIEAAIACGAKTVIVPECGHAYVVLRWQAAELYGKPLPFRVLHVTEFLAEQLDAGKLRLRKADVGKATFHDPCQIVRKGGVTEAPRKLMAALGLDLHELDDSRGFSFCCAGGGGVMLIQRAAPLRYRAMENKLREIDATGADTFLTTCSGCRATFDDGKQHFNWNKSPQSLLELVAGHLE